MTDITAGTAVRHTKRPDMQGRVRRLLGERALVTWVWRHLPSYVRLEFLAPITDADLARLVAEREVLKARWARQTEGGPYPISPPRPMSDDNRDFLLGQADIGAAVDEARERAWPELTMGCEL